MLVIPTLAACGGNDSGDNGTLTVFAAASLTASFSELGNAFEAANDEVTVEFNFAGSQALATQLLEGASADVFASADIAQLDRITEADLHEGEPVIFARNQLVIIVPDDNPASVQSMSDLGNPDLKLVLAAEDVPIGRYAREVLSLLVETPESEFTDFNIVSTETNVNQVVTRVRLGEADAGIVYKTDVTGDVAGEVITIAIPDELNVIAEYPIVGLSDGDTELAAGFIQFVRSDEGQQILANRQFRPGDSE